MNGYKTIWFAAGIAVGVASGVALTLLLAPVRGDETREHLKSFGKDLSVQGREVAQRAMIKSKEVAARGRDRLTSEAEKVKTRLRSEETPKGASSDEEASATPEMVRETS